MTHAPFFAMKWEEMEKYEPVFRTRKKEPKAPFFRLM